MKCPVWLEQIILNSCIFLNFILESFVSIPSGQTSWFLKMSGSHYKNLFHKIESTVRYLGIDGQGALASAENLEL